MDMLRITNLYKSFGDKNVLSGLDLIVPEHSIFGFVGRNGAGKTTTMKMILGLQRPDAGEIMVNGAPVAYGKTSKHVGYLPDVPEFYSFMTAREYLRFSSKIAGLEQSKIDHRVDELLSIVGLSGETHRIRGFSRGMKQRLGIAEALLARPKLLICDEPTSALDPVGRREILDVLLSIKSETTVLFSTHILSDVERICTDVAFLDNGIAEMCGKIADIKTKYSFEEYCIDLNDPTDAPRLTEAFASIKAVSSGKMTFRADACPLADVLRFLADNNIGISRLEREEPTLESLFMEVTGK